MNNGFSPSRRAWNRVMTVLVWASAVLFVFIMLINVVLNVVLKGGNRDE